MLTNYQTYCCKHQCITAVDMLYWKIYISWSLNCAEYPKIFCSYFNSSCRVFYVLQGSHLGCLSHQNLRWHDNQTFQSPGDTRHENKLNYWESPCWFCQSFVNLLSIVCFHKKSSTIPYFTLFAPEWPTQLCCWLWKQLEATVCPEQEEWPWGWPLQHEGESKWRMCCSNLPYCTKSESILMMFHFLFVHHFLCVPLNTYSFQMYFL